MALHPSALACCFILSAGPLLADAQANAIAAEKSERRLALQPEDETAWSTLAQVRLEQGDLSQTRKALERWAAAVPGKRLALYERITGDFANEEKDLSRAVAAWQRYTLAAPEDPAGWDRLAWGYERMGLLPATLWAIGNGLKAKANASRYGWKARVHLQLRDWAGAQAALIKGNQLDATDGEVQKYYPIFERLEQWLPELKKLDARLASDPDDRQARMKRVELLYREGLRGPLHEEINLFLQHEPTALYAIVWRGMLAREEKRPQDAGGVAPIEGKRLLSDEAGWVRTIDAEKDPEKRAEILFAHRQAVLALREVEGIDGSVTRARALFALSRLPEAGRASRRAVEQHPRSQEAWLTLAKLESVNGNGREAIDAYRKVLEINPASTAAREGIKNVEAILAGTPSRP